MAPKNSLNIHVTYGSLTSILITTRHEFLKKVCEKYSLKEDEIQIFDSKEERDIGVDDLKDFIKVKIKKKTSPAVNGVSHAPGPSVLSKPGSKGIVRKILDCKDFTGQERAFLVDVLEDFYHQPLKRKKEEDSLRPEMKNRKVQVALNLTSAKTTCTQTDELINYKPSLNSSISANDIMTQSKRLACANKIDSAIATDLMSKSFDKRRNFILVNLPLAAFIKEKYPLLFSNSEVRNELDRIFYIGKCNEFLANVEKYAPVILSIARDDDPLLLTTRHKMTAFKTVAQRRYAQEVGALLMISSLVQEDRHFLNLSDKNSSTKDLPYIQCQAKQNDLYFDQHIFKIYVEGLMLCEASDFKEAILCLVASYFIFNIKYHDDNFSTLVTFEKLFLEANDTDDKDIDMAVQQILRSIQLKWQAKSGS